MKAKNRIKEREWKLRELEKENKIITLRELKKEKRMVALKIEY